MASAVNPIASSPSTTQTPPSASTTSSPPTEQMFLQLLVSQIQNQDPLNPTDGAQFVAQLAQFSELEQVIAIRGDIEAAQWTNAQGTNAGAQGTGTSSQSGNTSSQGATATAGANTTQTQNTQGQTL